MARRSAVYGRASRGFQTPVNNSRRDNLGCVIAGRAPGSGSRSAIGWEWIWFGIIRRLSPDHEHPGSCIAHGDAGVATSVRNAASTLTIACFRRPRRDRGLRRGGVMARKGFASCPGHRSRRRSPRCRARPRSRAVPRGWYSAAQKPGVSVGLAGGATVAPTVRWMIRLEGLPGPPSDAPSRTRRAVPTAGTPTPTPQRSAAASTAATRCAYRAKRRAEWQRPAAQVTSGGRRWAYPARLFPRSIRNEAIERPGIDLHVTRTGRATHAVGAIRAAEPRHTSACCCVPLSIAAADVSVSSVCCAPVMRRNSRRGHRKGLDLRKRVFGPRLAQRSQRARPDSIVRAARLG